MNLSKEDAGCAVFFGIVGAVVIVGIICLTVIIVTGHGGDIPK